MKSSHGRMNGIWIFVVLCFWVFFPECSCRAEKKTDHTGDETAISLPEDMGESIMAEAVEVQKELHKQAKSLFHREPLQFTTKTIYKLVEWFIALPTKIPSLIQHIMEQGRFLGIIGSLIIMSFLGVMAYSIIGRKRVLSRLVDLAKPIEKHLPLSYSPFFTGLLYIIAASLVPFILYGFYRLISAMINYSAAWFLLSGEALKIWAVGALVLSMLQVTLIRGLFPISIAHGASLFRASRIVVVYVLFCDALYQGAEIFELPADILSLLKFLISFSIVIASGILVINKPAMVSLILDLPYRLYQIFYNGVIHLYYVIMTATFLTGLLWSFGYRTLSQFLWMKSWVVAFAFIGIMLLYDRLHQWLQHWIELKDISHESAHHLHRTLRTLLLLITITSMVVILSKLLGISEPIIRVTSPPFIMIGKSSISIWILFKSGFIFLVFIYISKIIRAFLDYRIYPSIGLDEGMAYSINLFIGYLVITIGGLVTLRVIGLDLRVLMVFAGAIGIGLGFGLQNLAADMISGLLLILGRRIRKGDWIEIGGTLGVVKEVHLRATKITNPDNIEYLIPNNQISATTIVNYTLSDPEIRIHIPIGVSYQAKPRDVETILLRCAEANPSISRKRNPGVWFESYGDSAINFVLFVWIDIRRISEKEVRSALYFQIFDELEKAGIEIPYPQRDIHIRTAIVPSPHLHE